MEYRVILETTTIKVEYCDCEHCRGHKLEKKFYFNKMIGADSEEDARREAIWLIKQEGDVPDKDLKNIIILKPYERKLTHRQELELLERWNNGLGLPDSRLDVEYSY